MRQKIKCSICGGEGIDKDYKLFSEEVFRATNYQISRNHLVQKIVAMEDISEKIEGKIRIVLCKDCEKKIRIAVKKMGRELDYSRNIVVLK